MQEFICTYLDDISCLCVYTYKFVSYRIVYLGYQHTAVAPNEKCIHASVKKTFDSKYKAYVYNIEAKSWTIGENQKNTIKQIIAIL